MELNTVHKKIKNKKKLNTHLLGGKTIGIHYDLVHQEYRIISHDLNFLLISFSRIDMFKIIIGLFLFFLIQIQSFHSSWLLNTPEYISNGADNLYMTKKQFDCFL